MRDLRDFGVSPTPATRLIFSRAEKRTSCSTINEVLLAGYVLFCSILHCNQFFYYKEPINVC